MFVSCLLKRALPFALALLAGVALWSLVAPRLQVARDLLYLEHDLRLWGGLAGEVSGGGPGAGGGGIDYGRPFTVSEVTKKAVLLSKPAPAFTDEARAGFVTGTVRLRALLRADGTVGEIAVIDGLPAGLTERAVAAARGIEFIPAQKDGRNVSQWVTIEYNFNLF